MNNKYINRLKDEFERNPLAVITVGALALNGVAKVIDAVSAAQGRKAYAQQVAYRVNNKH